MKYRNPSSPFEYCGYASWNSRVLFYFPFSLHPYATQKLYITRERANIFIARGLFVCVRDFIFMVYYYYGWIFFARVLMRISSGILRGRYVRVLCKTRRYELCKEIYRLLWHINRLVCYTRLWKEIMVPHKPSISLLFIWYFLMFFIWQTFSLIDSMWEKKNGHQRGRSSLEIFTEYLHASRALYS